MCGIIGYIGIRDAQEVLEDGLSKLEYRGYDSSGIAVLDEEKLEIKKDTGLVNDLMAEEFYQGKIGIGHTRWATHGGVTRKNAHPHVCCNEEVAVVHNGIIENHDELKNRLAHHNFTSETDTEIIPHFIEEKVEEGESVKEALKELQQIIEGTYAVLAVRKEHQKIYATKQKSPLAIGHSDGEMFVASDIYAFSGYTNEASFLEDGDIAVVDSEGHKVFSSSGEEVERKTREFEWEEKTDLGEEFDHHMIKEIHEQPKSVERLIKSFESQQKKDFRELANLIESSDRVVLTAAGTSYHSSLIGERLLREHGVDARAYVASEFEARNLGENTLVIAVSQSGETMDVLDSIEKASVKGCKISSIVNVPHSTIQRKSDTDIEIMAGQEICVASTKTYTNQVLSFYLLSGLLGREIDTSSLSENLERTIKENIEIAKIYAERFKDQSDIYVLGRNEMFPVAREIALKLKEISYVHAEGLRGGELKHGTLALIEEGTPVLSLMPSKEGKINSNVEEVESRDAESIRLSPHFGGFDIPDDGFLPIHFATVGFLLTYFTAKNKELPIDKPRNLAKSVTVR